MGEVHYIQVGGVIFLLNLVQLAGIYHVESGFDYPAAFDPLISQNDGVPCVDVETIEIMVRNTGLETDQLHLLDDGDLRHGLKAESIGMNLEMPSITSNQLHIRFLILVLCTPLEFGLLCGLGGGVNIDRHCRVISRKKRQIKIDEGVKFESKQP